MYSDFLLKQWRIWWCCNTDCGARGWLLHRSRSETPTPRQPQRPGTQLAQAGHAPGVRDSNETATAAPNFTPPRSAASASCTLAPRRRTQRRGLRQEASQQAVRRSRPSDLRFLLLVPWSLLATHVRFVSSVRTKPCLFRTAVCPGRGTFDVACHSAGLRPLRSASHLQPSPATELAGARLPWPVV